MINAEGPLCPKTSSCNTSKHCIDAVFIAEVDLDEIQLGVVVLVLRYSKLRSCALHKLRAAGSKITGGVKKPQAICVAICFNVYSSNI